MVTTMVLAESRFLLTSCNHLERQRRTEQGFQALTGDGVYPPSLLDEEVELGQCPALQRVMTVAPKGRNKTRCLTGLGWVCVLPSAPCKPVLSSSSPKVVVPKALREQARRLIAFSWSWGSLSRLTVGLHPTCTGTICSSTMAPVPAVPSPPALPGPTMLQAEPISQTH